MDKKEPKPFVKWAGGKRQLLDILLDNIPESFSNYHEPFVGGGALYFKLWSKDLIKKAYLNDFNSELMEAYRTIKNRPTELIEELKSSMYKNEKETYYKIRAIKPDDSIDKVARFLYLNKTAFNGLYRVNSKGEFNVPFGKYKNPTICDEENIMLVSEALRKATLLNDDFSIVLKYAMPKDFVYFDPPYQPISRTANFTNYTRLDFTEKDQIRLNNVYSNLDTKEIYVMLSNSTAPLITQLYSNYKTLTVQAKRTINCKADRRGPVSEIVALNYK